MKFLYSLATLALSVSLAFADIFTTEVITREGVGTNNNNITADSQETYRGKVLAVVVQYTNTALIATGSVTPASKNCVGYYKLGTYGSYGMNAYNRDAGTYYLWRDATGTNFISRAVGSVANGAWYNNATGDLAGVYTPNDTIVTGNVTVAICTNGILNYTITTTPTAFFPSGRAIYTGTLVVNSDVQYPRAPAVNLTGGTMTTNIVEIPLGGEQIRLKVNTTTGQSNGTVRAFLMLDR
jgi:hypothetical protein